MALDKDGRPTERREGYRNIQPVAPPDDEAASLRQELDDLSRQLTSRQRKDAGRLSGLERIRRDLPWGSPDQIVQENGDTGTARKRIIQLSGAIKTGGTNTIQIDDHGEHGGVLVPHWHFQADSTDILYFFNIRLPNDAVPQQELDFIWRWDDLSNAGNVVWFVNVYSFASSLKSLGGGSAETSYAAPTVSGDTVENTIIKINAPPPGATIVVNLGRTGADGNDTAGDTNLYMAALVYTAFM